MIWIIPFLYLLFHKNPFFSIFLVSYPGLPFRVYFIRFVLFVLIFKGNVLENVNVLISKKLAYF